METRNKNSFLPVRLVTSLIAAIYICLHGRWERSLEALVTPAFYLALVISFSITYLLLFWIHKVNSILNRKVSYNNNKILRILLQLALGVIVPGIIDLIFIVPYFWLKGTDIYESDFLLNDFPIVLTFSFVVSAIHLAISISRSKKKPTAEMLEIDYNGNYVKLNPSTDVLFFYRDRKLVCIHTSAGSTYHIKSTISQLTVKLESSGFVKINPSTAVNLKMLKGYSAGITRDTLQVIFKGDYQAHIKTVDEKLLRVTKENIQNFKRAFEAVQA